jgi:hypothetical protein
MNQLRIDGCRNVEPASSTLPTDKPPARTVKRLPRKLPERITLAQLQNELAKELGEGIVPKIKRRSWGGWARSQLVKGAWLARYAWRLHSRPKPLYLHLEGYGANAVLLMRDETGTDSPYALTWSDLNECDWFAATQLELAR